MKLGPNIFKEFQRLKKGGITHDAARYGSVWESPSASRTLLVGNSPKKIEKNGGKLLHCCGCFPNMAMFSWEKKTSKAVWVQVNSPW